MARYCWKKRIIGVAAAILLMGSCVTRLNAGEAPEAPESIEDMLREAALGIENAQTGVNENFEKAEQLYAEEKFDEAEKLFAEVQKQADAANIDLGYQKQRLLRKRLASIQKGMYPYA